LVDFVCAMPSHYKLRDGTGKWVLRRAMRGLIPDDILAARKQGFAPPEDAWFRGAALGYLRDVLLAPRALERDVFQPAAIRRVLEEHAAGRRGHKKLLCVAALFRMVEPHLRRWRMAGGSEGGALSGFRGG